MITLPASLDIAKLEQFIAKVDSVSSDTMLELPVGSNNFAFGGYAAAVQAVNTWAYANNERKIFLKHSSENKEERLRDIIRSPHKFTAVMMAKIIKTSHDDIDDIRKEINALAKKEIDNQSEKLYGQNKGRLCWYSFVDHSTKGFDRNFYSVSSEHYPEPHDIEKITHIIKAMVGQSAKVAGGNTLPSEKNIENLGRMFYEFFVNTHEHGSRGMDRSQWLKPATRLIYTYGINLTETAINNITEDDKIIEKYISNLESTKKSSRRFVEISIVDSGLGYCGRWLADHPHEGNIDDISIYNEYNILKKCFQFRSSSTKSGVKGNGLPAVMANLTLLNGFMRIRSNRLSVYRDFVNHPYRSHSDDIYEFIDWENNESCPKGLTAHPKARGVSVTVLIPLYDKDESKEQVE
ncbi:hypothetical protein [Pectobacterium colocasium]|uniref:hypothetical protein n=1 Tax=Pectobacterium colocasium TaxID=2878098 RepID=UPI001CD22211|nr:hypothetical protein [Pectobacterium colocasium]